MNKKIVIGGQSFLDKVLECTGDVNNAFEMALLNGLSITEDVVIGVNLKLSEVNKPNTASFFNEFNKPATALTQEQLTEIENKGIGHMRIGTTFIVG
ncbi:hypothetical protein ACFX5D_13980 [Flavobacterium sp. LB3P45]|uniref:Uncharacterized protein n=1 Tax=Flavobacterium fructosi TaxID=3230416 RepID=A0ABW6HPV4_9FLAO